VAVHCYDDSTVNIVVAIIIIISMVPLFVVFVFLNKLSIALQQQPLTTARGILIGGVLGSLDLGDEL